MTPSESREASGIHTELARAWGARRAWLVALPSEDVLARVIGGLEGVRIATPLDGSPLDCVDLRERGKRARACGEALVVDDSLPGVAGCASVRLGAHVSLVRLGPDLCLVGVSRDAERALPGVSERLDLLPQVGEQRLAAACALLDEQERRWQATSDAAQVVASYLRCHPRVAEVRYPGLKHDPAFAVAARTLQHGFGPLVDVLLKDSPERWQRITCTADDVRAQVLRLEELLSSRPADRIEV